MAFRFPLEVLLRVRQGLERQQELRLREANLRVAMLLQQIKDVLGEIENITAGRQLQMESGISAAELQFDVLCHSVLTDRQHTLEKQVIEAKTQREVMDTLRHHQLQDYQRQEARQDQRRLDDLFLLRRAYLRNS
jgi:flagellar biosynthesis chaperone FliJ